MVAEGEVNLSGPLDRRERARTGRHADLWRRLEATELSSRWGALPERDVAITTNLLELATLGDAAAFRRLDQLLARYGHERVAAVQNRADQLLGTGGDLSLLTLAIRRLSNPLPVEWRLAASGLGHEEAARIAGLCYSHVFWMLLTGVEDADPPLRITTPAQLVDVMENGTARQWRAVVAPIARSPWGPDGERLVALATAARLPVVGRALNECRRVYRLRQEEQERLVVAREIRRLVAVSGLSQREFSAYVGTSPSRLSTYVTGKVTPSAAMLLRIRGAARMLGERGRIA